MLSWLNRARYTDASRTMVPIWRSRQMTRKQAYRRMAEILTVSEREAHISMLSKDNLEKLIRSLKRRLQREGGQNG